MVDQMHCVDILVVRLGPSAVMQLPIELIILIRGKAATVKWATGENGNGNFGTVACLFDCHSVLDLFCSSG